MRLVNGLRAAGRIRQMDEKVSIIFLTTLTQYGLEGYKYQAVNYNFWILSFEFRAIGYKRDFWKCP